MDKLTIAQASLCLGLRQNVIRRKVRLGELPGERVPWAGGYRWMIHVVQDKPDNWEIPDDTANLVEVLRDQLREKDHQISELHQLLGGRCPAGFDSFYASTVL